MAVERTLSIIKPDAVAKNVIGKIYARFEDAGLYIVAAQMRHLSHAEAEGFYAVHRARPFFKALVAFMISGPVAGASRSRRARPNLLWIGADAPAGREGSCKEGRRPGSGYMEA